MSNEHTPVSDIRAHRLVELREHVPHNGIVMECDLDGNACNRLEMLLNTVPKDAFRAHLD